MSIQFKKMINLISIYHMQDAVNEQNKRRGKTHMGRDGTILNKVEVEVFSYRYAIDTSISESWWLCICRYYDK